MFQTLKVIPLVATDTRNGPLRLVHLNQTNQTKPLNVLTETCSLKRARRKHTR